MTEIHFDEEFAVFDRADGIPATPPTDHRQVADRAGNLYGYVLSNASDQHLRELGTWHQQIAEFPIQIEGAVWHGYPIWPIDGHFAPPRRAGQSCRPGVEIFDRMMELGDIDLGQRKRLKSGDWI